MRSPYFFFRPLLSAHNVWAGFDFSSGREGGASVQDTLRCIREANVGSLGATLPVVLSLQPKWLDNDELLTALKPKQVIHLLPQEVLGAPGLLERCKRLRDTGHHLGIRIVESGAAPRIPVASFDHVCLSALFARTELPASELAFLCDSGLHKIATDVNSHETYGWLQSRGFQFCGSSFMALRNPAFGRQPDLARLKLLKLLSIVEHDGDTREIEAIFREEPKLSYNLLRLVNSVAVGARTRISNFSQAIAILGRRQLQRWLQLLIYANNLTEGNAANPLMQLAAARGRLIELLCKSTEASPGSQEHCDNAFMTGLFSLLDVLVNMPMSDILKELPLQEEVVAALESPMAGGILGKLLSVVTHTESGNFDAAEALLDDLDIAPDTHAAAQIMAYHWAAHINMESN